MILMMNTDDKLIGPLNIGNPNEITVNELALRIIKLTTLNQSWSIVIYQKMIPKRMPNISLAKEKLNWKPKISLESGLIETIKYFKNLIL